MRSLSSFARRCSGVVKCVLFGLAIAGLACGGCGKPIAAEWYSRTPDGITTTAARIGQPLLRIGVGAESPKSGEAFINHASGAPVLRYADWATADRLHAIDCQVDCVVTFEHSGNQQVHYCLGRLIANIYNADHSKLLNRVVKFQEAMYTADKKDETRTHDGIDVHSRVQAALFDDLITDLTAGGTSVAASVSDVSNAVAR